MDKDVKTAAIYRQAAGLSQQAKLFHPVGESPQQPRLPLYSRQPDRTPSNARYATRCDVPRPPRQKHSLCREWDEHRKERSGNRNSTHKGLAVSFRRDSS